MPLPKKVDLINRWVCCFLGLGFSACVGMKENKATKVRSISGIRLLSQYEMPFNQSVFGTTLGGLSGIDYHFKENVFYFICDDRSAINPARFYTAKIILSPQGIDSVIFLSQTKLRNSHGQAYPSNKQNPAATPDPEGIRFNPIQQNFIWTNEGERLLTSKDTILGNPSILVIDKSGLQVDSFPLPSNLRMQAANIGPRINGVLEGISFSHRYQRLWVSLEEPLFQDGPKADLSPNGAWVRFYEFNTSNKKNRAQYAYLLDPVAYEASPANAFKVNGIPDILHIGNHQMLVLERSFSSGRLPCTIKLFLANTKGADNIKDNPSLQTEKNFTPVQKKLLLNLDDLKIYTDNMEGICLGPRLPNGHQTLWMVSDNNFNGFQKQQLFLFELLP